MPTVAGRPRPVASGSTVALAASVVLAVVAGCSSTERLPVATQVVAGRTSPPATPSAPASGPPGTPIPRLPGPSEGPGGPNTTPARMTAIIPGAVDRTSLELTATYQVNAAITVGSGALDVSTAIIVRNDSGDGIDRVELNTIAARLGGLSIVAATVDDGPVRAAVDDQTISVPLGGVLPAGATSTVRIQYRATLRKGTSGSDWMFSRADGTLALYRWIPWVSVATPFDRPNAGQPFVTQRSPRVDVELLTDEPMVLAAPTADLDAYAAGSGTAWSFAATDVRDVALVLAPEFRVASGEADGVPVRAFSRPGGPSATQLLDLVTGAIRAEVEQLGVAYPVASMTVVDMPAGVALESPGMVWVPRTLDTRNRSYAIYKGVAHQWFYGLVGNDQRAEPFADEGPADLLARTVLHTLRASRCGQSALDRPLTGYSSGCYYEVVLVQGGRVLDELRRRMGSDEFWAAMRAYLDAYGGEVAGTRQLLETLRAGTAVDLLPILRSRFPSLY